MVYAECHIFPLDSRLSRSPIWFQRICCVEYLTLAAQYPVSHPLFSCCPGLNIIDLWPDQSAVEVPPLSRSNLDYRLRGSKMAGHLFFFFTLVNLIGVISLSSGLDWESRSGTWPQLFKLGVCSWRRCEWSFNIIYAILVDTFIQKRRSCALENIG